MKVNPAQLALAQALSGFNKPGQEAKVAASQTGFSDVFKEMIKKTNDSQMVAAEKSERLQMDDPNVSIEETVLASNVASLNFQFLLQARNKVTESYEKLMNTPI